MEMLAVRGPFFLGGLGDVDVDSLTVFVGGNEARDGNGREKARYVGAVLYRGRT